GLMALRVSPLSGSLPGLLLGGGAVALTTAAFVAVAVDDAVDTARGPWPAALRAPRFSPPPSRGESP
ncbi:MAG: hypothetical protein AAFX50_01425, partial [Acidobacteriota bacterium]